MPKIVTDSTITIQDPALVSRKRSYPDVLLRNRKITASKDVNKTKDATYITDEFETTKTQYIEIFSELPPAAGNTGEVQFNNNLFAGDPKFTWDEINNELTVELIDIDGILNTPKFISSDFEITTNYKTFKLLGNGEIELPNYTIPNTSGLPGQTIITDSNGNLSWEYVSSSTDTITVLNNSVGTVTHNFNLGQTFYHTNIQNNFITNVINLNLTNNYATNIYVVLEQGATSYISSAFQIGGVDQVINWVGGIFPSGNSYFIDVITFSIIRVDNVYTVFAQLNTFGSV